MYRLNIALPLRWFPLWCLASGLQ